MKILATIEVIDIPININNLLKTTDATIKIKVVAHTVIAPNSENLSIIIIIATQMHIIARISLNKSLIFMTVIKVIISAIKSKMPLKKSTSIMLLNIR